MENHKNKAILNSMTSVFAQIVAVIFSLFIRRYLVRTFGVEIVGINGVFNELISLLSLFEIGIATSIVYRLVAPISNNNQSKILKLFIIIKRSYRVIGCCMLVACIGCMLLLNVIVPAKSVSREYLYVAFLVLAFGAVGSFFISYYRTVFVAYERQYFCNIMDLSMYFAFNILKLGAISILKNFLLYLCFQSLQSFCSHLLIRYFCNKQYPFLRGHSEVTKEDTKEVYKDIKNISVGRMAGYVYSSTDNSIISAICGTVTAGYISNYKMIFSPLRNVINILNTALVPTWGSFADRQRDKQKVYQLFQIYTFFEYLLTIVLVIPTMVLIDQFITLWIGEEYLISMGITLLMGMDVFINTMQEPNVTVMNAVGYFKENKIVSEIATLINIVVSIMLAFVWGTEGVLIGTILALLIFLIGRSLFVYRKFFQFTLDRYVQYLVAQMGYFLLFAVQLLGMRLIVKKAVLSHSALGFLGQCILCEALLLGLNICMWRRNTKYKYIKDIIVEFAKTRLKRSR